MSSANCCMSRTASSPDSLAPRQTQVRPPSRSLLVASKCPDAASCSVFSSGTVSPLSKQEDIAELQAIFEDDKSSSGEGNPCPKPKKSSSSLASVKSRLKKRLSRDLKVYRRRSRSSVGTSEEEVERRAELRRIRQRRIQEELSNDVGYDSDAKSLPTIAAVDSASEENGDEIPSRFLPMISHRRPIPSLFFPSQTSQYLQERRSQLETRRSPTLKSPSFRTSRSQSEAGLTDSSNIRNTPSTKVSRRHSSPNHTPPKVSMTEVDGAINDQSIIPSIPPAPTLKPQRLPSFLSKSSWRLSFASENRGVYLRSLSQDETSNPCTRDVMTPQPINRWLRSQGLRSTSQALTWSDDNSNLEPSRSYSHTYSINDADGTEVPTDETHLQDMIISQRLASRLQSSPPLRKLRDLDDRSIRRNAFCNSDAIKPLAVMREFPLVKHRHRDSNDENLSFYVSETKFVDKGDMFITSKASFSNPKRPDDSKAPLAQQPTVSVSLQAANLAVKSYDGCMDKGPRTPLPASLVAITPYAENGDIHTDRVNHLVGQDVAEAWKQAIYLNTHSKDTYISNSLTLPSAKGGHMNEDSKKQIRPIDNRDIKFTGFGSVKSESGLISPTTSNTPKLRRKDGYFDEWEDRLNKAMQKAKSRRRVEMPDRRYPASWSKFSSHDRMIRTASAGADDRVAQTDFAVAGVEDGKTVWYVNERSNHLYHHEGDDHESHNSTPKNGFFERWEKKVKDKISQVESVQTDVVLDRTHGRRGSLAPSKPTEYPELELLPGDTMTVAQMEAYAKEKLEEEDMKRQKEELQAIFSTDIWRQESASNTRQPRVNTRMNRLQEKEVAPDELELDDLTPTKSLAERDVARKSRKLSGKMLSTLSQPKPQGANDAGPRSQSARYIGAKTKVMEKALAIEEKIASWRAKAKKPSIALPRSLDCLDGNMDNKHDDASWEGSKYGIGSSGFYDDCIVTPGSNNVYSTERNDFEATSKWFEKGAFGTWSPGDWERYKIDGGAILPPRKPLDPGHLRKSTDDFHSELKKMERFEMENVLRIAEAAWGRGQ